MERGIRMRKGVGSGTATEQQVRGPRESGSEEDLWQSEGWALRLGERV